MRESVISVIILLTVLATINLTSAIVGFYSIRADILEIPDKNIKLVLLRSLQPIYKTFFRRVIYHSHQDHFDCRESYLSYLSYLNSIDFRMKPEEIDLFHRVDSSVDFDFDFDNLFGKKKKSNLEVYSGEVESEVLSED